MKIPEQKYVDCRQRGNRKSKIENRKSQNGFVLVLVIMTVAIIGIEMFVLAGITNRMQFESQRAYLQACERNLMASGLAWAKRNIPDKAGESSAKTVQLDVSEMNIRVAALDVTISPASDKEADVLVNTSCSRGRQTLKTSGTYKIGLYDKQETTPGARQEPAGD